MVVITKSDGEPKIVIKTKRKYLQFSKKISRAGEKGARVRDLITQKVTVCMAKR